MENDKWKIVFSSPPNHSSSFLGEAMKGVEPLSSGLQDRRSVTHLSYIAIRNWWTGRDSNPHKKFAGLLCSRLHHQPGTFIIYHSTFFICYLFACARRTDRIRRSAAGFENN